MYMHILWHCHQTQYLLLYYCISFRSVQDKPYGSVAATFYLLAEAERHRKLHVQSPQHVVPPCQINASMLGGTGGGETANHSRKISVPAQPPLNNM